VITKNALSQKIDFFYCIFVVSSPPSTKKINFSMYTCCSFETRQYSPSIFHLTRPSRLSLFFTGNIQAAYDIKKLESLNIKHILTLDLYPICNNTNDPSIQIKFVQGKTFKIQIKKRVFPFKIFSFSCRQRQRRHSPLFQRMYSIH
jgi:hypothetical protein